MAARGFHAGKGSGIVTGSRTMRSGSPSAYIPHELYRDAGHTQPYPSSGPISGITVSANGTAFSLPIYGQINKSNPLRFARWPSHRYVAGDVDVLETAATRL